MATSRGSFGLSSILWTYTLFSIVDGKGGGGGGATVAVSPVTVTQTGSTILGADIKLQCDFKTLANPESIFWFQGNDIVYANQGNMSFVSTRLNVSTEDFKTTKSHHITIKQATLDDSKSITCQVKPKGKAEESGKFALVISPQPKTVKLSSTIQLLCKRKDTSGIMIWKKEKSIIAIEKKVLGSNLKYTLNGLTLTVYNISVPDVGTYTCFFDGQRVYAVTVALEATVKPPAIVHRSSLRGYRGYVFGGSLAVIILGTLAVALYIQNKPFKGS